MRQHRHQGFTLIELIIVIILLGILISGSTSILYVGFNAFFGQKNIINTNWQASVALERMTRDLRAVGSTNDLTAAESNTVTINDLSNNSIIYALSGNTLTRNGDILADNVQQISFSYYNGTSTTPLTPLPLSSVLKTAVRYIVITLTMAGANVNFPITTAVYLWNLK